MVKRVIFCGGRNFKLTRLVQDTLNDYSPADTIVVHGAAPGADRLVGDVAEAYGFVVEPHPAEWTAPCRPTCRPGHRRVRSDGVGFCPAAGAYRNQLMLDLGADEVVGFPGGNGTLDMLTRARDSGVSWRAVGWKPSLK